MRKDLQEALAECLTRLEAGEEIEACLRDQGDTAAELRPLLEAAAAVRGLTVEPYSPQAFQSGKARLRASVAGRHARRGPLQRPLLALATVAALLAVVALLALTTDLFRFGSTPTEAHVQGVLSAVQEGKLLVTTADKQITINFTDATQVVDPKGQAQTPLQIPPGGSVRIEVEKQDGVLTAVQVEVEEEHENEEEDQGPAASPVEVEFSGTVTAVKGGDLTVLAAFGTALVHVTPQTEVEGALAQGVAIKVHATRQADGSFSARKIDVLAKVNEEDDQEQDEGQGSNSGPGNGGDNGDEEDDGHSDAGSGHVQPTPGGDDRSTLGSSGNGAAIGSGDGGGSDGGDDNHGAGDGGSSSRDESDDGDGHTEDEHD